MRQSIGAFPADAVPLRISVSRPAWPCLLPGLRLKGELLLLAGVMIVTGRKVACVRWSSNHRGACYQLSGCPVCRWGPRTHNRHLHPRNGPPLPVVSASPTADPLRGLWKASQPLRATGLCAPRCWGPARGSLRDDRSTRRNGAGVGSARSLALWGGDQYSAGSRPTSALPTGACPPSWWRSGIRTSPPAAATARLRPGALRFRSTSTASALQGETNIHEARSFGCLGAHQRSGPQKGERFPAAGGALMTSIAAGNGLQPLAVRRGLSKTIKPPPYSRMERFEREGDFWSARHSEGCHAAGQPL